MRHRRVLLRRSRYFGGGVLCTVPLERGTGGTSSLCIFSGTNSQKSPSKSCFAYGRTLTSSVVQNR